MHRALDLGPFFWAAANPASSGGRFPLHRELPLMSLVASFRVPDAIYSLFFGGLESTIQPASCAG